MAAVARKLVVQVWHLLSGNAPTIVEPNKSLTIKLQKLIVILGKSMRAEMGLPISLAECVLELQRRMISPAQKLP